MGAELRRHPLQPGGWARDMQGDRVKLVSMRVGPLGLRYWTVRYEDNHSAVLLEGYLESTTEFAP